MRIAFDARPLLGPRTGVGVWLEGLLRGLARTTDWSFVLCLPRRAEVGLADLAERVEVCAPPVPLPGTLWLHTLAGPLAAASAEIHVATLAIVPRRLPLPAAMVLHDLTPLTRPLHHTLANRFCFNAYVGESLARADVVVCVSAATRDRLQRLMPHPRRDVRVIGEGVDPFFSPRPAGDDGEDARNRFAGGRPFLVQLGTLEPRKGIGTLLAAHALLVARRPDAPSLVLAGGEGWGRGWLARALGAHPRPELVHLTGYVSREAARELLRHAEVVVAAAEEEGFGLPLAEAMACGAACVTSDEPALCEVSAGSALQFRRGDVAALSDRLMEALDPSRRETLRAAARERAGRLGWEGPVTAWRELLPQLRMAHHAASRNRRP